MRNVIVMIILSVVSSSAMAGWIRIEGNESLTAYVNPSTIRKNGDTVTMSTLFDYKTEQTMDDVIYLSIKGQDEYNCKTEQRRTSVFSLLSGNMGGGNIVSSKHPEKYWKPIHPDTVDEYLWKYACRKT